MEVKAVEQFPIAGSIPARVIPLGFLCVEPLEPTGEILGHGCFPWWKRFVLSVNLRGRLRPEQAPFAATRGPGSGFELNGIMKPKPRVDFLQPEVNALLEAPGEGFSVAHGGRRDKR